jgi:serine/threonine-protein phosphatase 4 catalytic subunit
MIINARFFFYYQLFKKGGETYLFLGDFVDSGYHSVETFLLLLSYKVRCPQKIHVLIAD